jgi:signal peptidase I
MLGCLFELLETLLLAVVFFMLVQLFVAQPYQVQQESMMDTLMPDQFVLVDKLSPNFDSFHRGDIVVFTPPEGWDQSGKGTPFIKRVIGLPGETIEIHGGFVYVDGAKIDEPYIFEGQATEADSGTTSWAVGKDQYFVMGDHRQASEDSREFGPIARSTIIGRAWFRYWPLDHAGLLPQYHPVPEPAAGPSSSASVPGNTPTSRLVTPTPAAPSKAP